MKDKKGMGKSEGRRRNVKEGGREGARAQIKEQGK